MSNFSIDINPNMDYNHTRKGGDTKMLQYKIDVLAELKEAGYSSYVLQKENLLSSSAMSKIRTGEVVGIAVIDKLCKLLDCQPGNIIKYVPD